MPFHLSRRRWVMLLGSTTMLAKLPAQTPAPQPAPVQPTGKAQSEVQQVSAKLAAIEVPMNVEPAFRFRA